MSYRKFFIGLSVMLAVLIPVNYFIIGKLTVSGFDTLYFFMYVYFAALITAAQLAAGNALKKRPQRFVIVFMATMGIKIFLSLILLVVILYFGGADKKTFGVNFMLVYLIFSSYSVSQILSAQRHSEVK